VTHSHRSVKEAIVEKEIGQFSADVAGL
jgi:hypothetical protein